MTGGVLSLDLGRTTGYGYADRKTVNMYPPGPFLAGRYRSSLQRPAIICNTFCIGPSGLPHGQYYSLFEAWLRSMLESHQPDAVVFEAAIPHHGGQEAARRAYGKVGIVDKLGFQHGVKVVREVANNTVKKHFAGNGRAQKEDMIAACRARGWTPPDHNAADACAILEVGIRVLKHGEVL